MVFEIIKTKEILCCVIPVNNYWPDSNHVMLEKPDPLPYLFMLLYDIANVLELIYCVYLS